MPELPDVETFRQYIDAHAVGKTIDHVEVENAYVLGGVSPKKLDKALHGRKLKATTRHGKNLFVELDNREFLKLHFGMTGEVQVFKKTDDEPKYTRVRFDLTNGEHLAYADLRMLGSVGVVRDVEKYIEQQHLGPDASDIDFETFKSILGKRRGKIKTALMDQEALAGIGNIYSDEILFQSRMHPNTDVRDLDEKQLRKIYKDMKHVLDVAIKHKAQAEKFPRTFITARRKKGEKCPRCKTTLGTTKVNGRTAWYCPQCQS